MTCERCNQDTYPLSFCPTKVSLITNRIKDGEWVCQNCYTPEEKKFVLKQEMLRRIQSAPPLTTYDVDVDNAWKTAEEFKCPKRREPTTRLTNPQCSQCSGELREECEIYVKALLLLHYVVEDKIKVLPFTERSWSLPT